MTSRSILLTTTAALAFGCASPALAATTFSGSAATQTGTLSESTANFQPTLAISISAGPTAALVDDRLVVVGLGTTVSGCAAEDSGVSCPLSIGGVPYTKLAIVLTGALSRYNVTLDLDRPGLRMLGTTTFGPQSGGVFSGAATSGADLTVTGGASSITGGLGDDVLTGGDAAVKLTGGPGDDVLRGGRGNDLLFGGPGDDSIAPGMGTSDVVDGGEGSQDTLSTHNIAGPVAISLDGVANDTGPGQTFSVAGIENLFGSPGADVLHGDAGFNHIWGLEGDDTIDGLGGGHDVLRGGGGEDVITARDATPLFGDVGCGPGLDTAVVDAADLVSGDCETVTRAPAPPGFAAPSFPGGPVQVPEGPRAGGVAGATANSRAKVTVSAPKRLRTSHLRRGVRLRVRSNQVVAVTAELVASAARVMPRAASVPKDNVVLARTTAKGVRASRTLTLRVAPSLRRGVRRVLVRVTAVNSAGQRTVVQRRLRVR